MTKLGDATSSLLEQRLQSLNDQVSAAAEASKTSMSAAIKQTQPWHRSRRMKSAAICRTSSSKSRVNLRN
jgi:hypothetical protein